MNRWTDLELSDSELAEGGRQLIYQFGVGLGFLATIRKDGGPRLHPICPIITNGGVYGFILPSPKLQDLRRNGQYALHSFPPAENDDEFYLTGKAVEIEDRAVREQVASSYHHDPGSDEVLFEFMIERCLLARYRERGAFPPVYTRWPSHGDL
jgi:hypothetical protein